MTAYFATIIAKEALIRSVRETGALSVQKGPRRRQSCSARRLAAWDAAPASGEREHMDNADQHQEPSSFWSRRCSLKHFLQSSAGARTLSIFNCQDPAVAWKSVTLATHYHAASIQAATACSSHRTKQGHMSVHGRQVVGLASSDPTLLLDYLQRLLHKEAHM